MPPTLLPLLPTPAERDEPDGTTAWSDEVGLPGPPRLLAWTVVQDDNATFDIHVLWDTDDLDQAMDAALAHAQAFFGPNLSGGSVFATPNSAGNGTRRRFGPDGWLADRGSSAVPPRPARPVAPPMPLGRLTPPPPAPALPAPVPRAPAPPAPAASGPSPGDHIGRTTTSFSAHVGEERRHVEVSITPGCRLRIAVRGEGPDADGRTGGSVRGYYYEVPPSQLEQLVVEARLSPFELPASIAVHWSDDFDELQSILEHELGLEKRWL